MSPMSESQDGPSVPEGEFRRGPFRPWSLTGSGREQQSVLPLDQRPVKAQQRRGLNSNGNLWEAVGSHQEGTNAEQ